ncbi:MAG: hypothetical protein EA397_09670 [Deltaproteobacteria bacterium]|nr:MAG: hypothetical protein EA397_09670 [Deltaproteobacteria bacterium]
MDRMIPLFLWLVFSPALAVEDEPSPEAVETHDAEQQDGEGRDADDQEGEELDGDELDDDELDDDELDGDELDDDELDGDELDDDELDGEEQATTVEREAPEEAVGEGPQEPEADAEEPSSVEPEDRVEGAPPSAESAEPAPKAQDGEAPAAKDGRSSSEAATPSPPTIEPPLLAPEPDPHRQDSKAAEVPTTSPLHGVREATDALMPRIVLRGWAWGIFLAFIAIIAWALAQFLNPLRDRLAANGVLPTAIRAVQHGLRIGAIFFVIGVIGAIVPSNLEPALPIIVIGAALAAGWSWRDLLPDLVAGLVLAAERRIRPGQWISTAIASGIVEQTTLRVTRIRDATGRQVTIPNRALLRDAVITDRGRWPTLEFELLVPTHHPPSAVRRVIEDAVLVSPWAAPLPPQMIREEQEPGRWRVRARILESRFADRFEGGLREHVEEVLERGSRLRS